VAFIGLPGVDVGLPDPAAHEDRGHVPGGRLAAQAGQQVVAVHVGQADVQDGDLGGAALGDQLKRLGRRGGPGRLVAGLPQPRDDELEEILVVVDDEHPCHADLPALRWVSG